MSSGKLTVLIVEDQELNRQLLRYILSSEYSVAEAENGSQALDYLRDHQNVSAVLLDIVMPVMDGYEFLRLMKGTPFQSVPVIAVTAEKDTATEQKALDLGAWDFVSKPYNSSILLTRLKNVIVRSQFYLVSEMNYAYEHDALTGLCSRSRFFAETRELLDGHPDTQFALVRFDIDRFHLLNSFWGEEEGNRFLRFVADKLRRDAKTVQPCTYARINADTFCMCEPYDEQVIGEHVKRACGELADYNRDYLIEPSFGVFVITDPREKIETMYEHATLAAKECKGKYMKYISYYRNEMDEKARSEQRIVGEMQYALDSGQFEAFLQPKYNLKTGKPYGAEALIRWRHPERGLVPPGAFIPVFERNGFIGKVDYYMWEQVCRLLRKWMDEGTEPAPISVNVSRVNMYNPNLVGLIKGLVEKYRIPPRLLNLELTESAYMDNPDLMSKAVLALQQAGFIVMMDDFGSGYSSLNTLKNIPVDMLKIDMKFLSGDAAAGRNECILASVVRMAGWLEIPVIMEGVETASQVDFLKSIGCGYVQGYYFARPMPVADYEKLVSGEKQDPVMSLSENHSAMFRTIWSSDPQIDLLFNSIGQPAAIYEFENGNFRALRVNSSFNGFFGYGEAVNGDLEREYRHHLPPESLSEVLGAFETAAGTRGTSRCEYTFISDGGERRSVCMSLRYWGSNENSPVLFALFSERGNG